MKALPFAEAQKAFILKQDADGMRVADICRKGGGATDMTEPPLAAAPSKMSL